MTIADNIDPKHPAPGRTWRWRIPTGGAAIVGGTTVLMAVLRLASSMVLTRLLDAEIFGIMGIIASILTIFQLVSDIGVGAYVIRHADGDDPRLLDQIWTIRLIRSAVLTVAAILLSWPIAAYAQKPAIQLPVAIAAFSFLIEGCSSMAFATAVRAGRLMRFSLMEVGAGLVQLVVSVALALIFRSVWALIAAMLINSAAKSWFSYALFPGAARRFRPDRARMRDLWLFSRYITGSTILTMILSQTDKVVLSRLFPLDILGFYVIAGTLAATPLSFAYNYTARVLYPIYARTWREQPDAIAQVFYQAKRRISLLYIFAGGGLVGAAPLVIAILYDPRYLSAGGYLRLLSISTMLLLGNAAANEALIAIGRVWTTLTVNIVRIAWLAVAGTGLYHLWGTTGLIAAVGTIELPALAYSWYCQYRANILIVREEALLLAAGVAGVAIGHGAWLLWCAVIG